MVAFFVKVTVGACLVVLCLAGSHAQPSERAPIPSILSGLSYDETGELLLSRNGQKLADLVKKDVYTLPQMQGNPTGSTTGIQLDFQKPGSIGTIAYGSYNEQADYPTVAFLPRTVAIQDGKALLELKSVLTGANDFFQLSQKGQGVIGYRVLDNTGRIIYEGRIAFTGKGPYAVVPTIVEGPFVNALAPTGYIISFDTQLPVQAMLSTGGRTVRDAQCTTHHELLIDQLQPATDYVYTLTYASRSEKHHFRTAPASGSRKRFTFAFAAVNRATSGGGERDFGGTNYQFSFLPSRLYWDSSP